MKNRNSTLKFAKVFFLQLYLPLLFPIVIFYQFFFWNGQLYNALIEPSKGLTEWLLIISSVGIFPLLVIGLLVPIKNYWYAKPIYMNEVNDANRKSNT